jgi:hypothetical protein
LLLLFVVCCCCCCCFDVLTYRCCFTLLVVHWFCVRWYVLRYVRLLGVYVVTLRLYVVAIRSFLFVTVVTLDSRSVIPFVAFIGCGCSHFVHITFDLR